MTSLPDHYAALGIDPTADPEVITAAYRALAKKFHPDTGAATGTASAERFDQVQKAYEVLRTPESRHAYDLELLAAAEAELAAHLAAKRRVSVPETESRAEASAAGAPPPDLGDIRPEPAEPHKPAQPRKPAARPVQKSGRSALPFAIPLALVAAVGAAGAWVFLPAGPEAPPLPSSAKTDSVVATAEPPATPAVKPAAPAAPAAPEAKPAEASAPAAPAPAASATAPAEAEKPVFGSTATEAANPVIEEAAASPEDGAPDPAASDPAAKADKPAFGSTADAVAPDAAQLPPPVPKAKPAQPKPVAKKTVAKPAPPKPAKQATAQQPRAKLVYQDPPQYDPRYDPRYDNGDYPPPGLEPPPGFEPPGYGEPDYPPPGYAPGGGPYRLVIFERQPGRPATAWSAGVVFKSFGKCTRQGVKAVLRRTGDMDPYGDTRVWYECQRLSQR